MPRTLWASRSHPLSDDEIIDRAQQLVAQEDRWGRWSGTFLTILGIAEVAALIWVTWVIQHIVNNNVFNLAIGPIWGGFAFGVVLGAMALHLAHNMTRTFLTGLGVLRGSLETERLLLRYHNALRMLAADSLGKNSPEAGETGNPAGMPKAS